MVGPASPQPPHPAERSTSALVPPRIKGYLPVRLRFTTTTSSSSSNDDVTFFYVKEHEPPGSRSSSSASNSDTLFVANCPVHPAVRSKRLLQSILGRYGDVRRVTLVDHPRGRGGVDPDGSTSSTNSHNNNNKKNDPGGVEADEEEDAMAVLGSWTTRWVDPSFLPSHAVPSSSRVDDEDDNPHPPSSSTHSGRSSSDHGKFAHVVFRSSQEMKRTLRRLTQVMTGADPHDPQQLPAITMDAMELQTLGDADASSHDNDPLAPEQPLRTGVQAVAARYRDACRRYSKTASSNGRAQLLEECNRVVQAWEERTGAEQRRLQAAAQEPDDDGFVTVAGPAAASAAAVLETAPGRQSSRRRGGARKKRKTMGGAQPLPDFYRFQTKETRKRSLQELRERFEQDLAKVQKRQQERQYAQPFG